MKLALVMPTFIYRPDRRALAAAGFRTLIRTNSVREAASLILLVKWSIADFPYPVSELSKVFHLTTIPQWADGAAFQGVSQPLIYGTDLAFRESADVAVHINDDSLFHPDWLSQLEALVLRRPGARAWSVYRSAHRAVHQELRADGPDVLVSSINGNGLAISRAEWAAWAPRWQDHAWPDDPRDPSVLTLDYLHAQQRPGERWVTAKSWMEHTGKDGVHCRPGIPEHAVDFVGTGA